MGNDHQAQENNPSKGKGIEKSRKMKKNFQYHRTGAEADEMRAQ